jgi:hypothetical protein
MGVLAVVLGEIAVGDVAEDPVTVLVGDVEVGAAGEEVGPVEPPREHAATRTNRTVPTSKVLAGRHRAIRSSPAVRRQSSVMPRDHDRWRLRAILVDAAHGVIGRECPSAFGCELVDVKRRAWPLARDELDQPVASQSAETPGHVGLDQARVYDVPCPPSEVQEAVGPLGDQLEDREVPLGAE